jgi:hypothetical protein
MAQHPIVGTWALDSVKFEDTESGERFDIYGANPSGYIMINEDGHVMAFLADSTRKPPQNPSDSAALFSNMMCYAGKYRLNGNSECIFSITAAWHPSWIGTDQVRFFDIKGNTLSITTAEQTHPNFPGRKGRGIVMWHKAS